MSALVFKEKSTSNIKAALLLYENEYYGSSVHCYYYSSFQLTIFVLLNKFGLSHEELRNEAFDAKRSMHKYYINKLTGTISNLQKRRMFENKKKKNKEKQKKKKKESIIYIKKKS